MYTWLFVPGHDARKAKKAIQSEADVVVLDWEDGVPPERKSEARAVTRDILGMLPSGRQCVVRINAATAPGFDEDIAGLLGLPLMAVMLPKARKPEEVARFADESGYDVLPIIETALGLESAHEIARSHHAVKRLVFGSLDFIADIHGRWSPDNAACMYARSRISVASYAAALPGPIDTVFPLLDDLEGLRNDAMAARQVGFSGKLVLHPSQLDTVRDVFCPSSAEIEEATAIVAAFEDAMARGESVVRFDGQFIDPPVILWARQMLKAANAGTK